MPKWIFLSLLLSITVRSIGQMEDRSLISETMLHPGDLATAYTFSAGEFSYQQAITPYPSWAWWGITDWLTAELDFEAWLGGVPSFNFRIGLKRQTGLIPTIAYETMFQFLGEEIDQLDKLESLEIRRQGLNWYHHLNTSWKLASRWHFHLSGGVTVGNQLVISNGEKNNLKQKSWNKFIQPDLSLGIDWRAKSWLGLIASGSYGSTFLYADNIARKQQISLASRVAPFLKRKQGFWHSFRFELAFIHVYFADAQESFAGPIGFVYWQW